MSCHWSIHRRSGANARPSVLEVLAESIATSIDELIKADPDCSLTSSLAVDRRLILSESLHKESGR